MMLGTLLAAASLLHPLAGDTTRHIEVRRGQRLDIEAHNGNVTIKASPRMVLQIESEGDLPDISTSGAVIRVDNSPGRQRGGDDDLVMSVPEAMDIRINAIDGDVSITGTTGAVEVENVAGNVTMTGGTGVISLHSVSGSLSLSGARGKVDLNTVNGDIHAHDITGPLTAETVNDEVILTDIRSDDVVVTSMNGDVSYDGSMQPSGRYRFTTHNGDATIRVPSGAGAVLDIATYNGDFESDFPITMSDKRGKRFTATLGNGGAKLAVESFSGTIRLTRSKTVR